MIRVFDTTIQVHITYLKFAEIQILFKLKMQYKLGRNSRVLTKSFLSNIKIIQLLDGAMTY